MDLAQHCPLDSHQRNDVSLGAKQDEYFVWQPDVGSIPPPPPYPAPPNQKCITTAPPLLHQMGNMMQNFVPVPRLIVDPVAQDNPQFPFGCWLDYIDIPVVEPQPEEVEASTSEAGSHTPQINVPKKVHQQPLPPPPGLETSELWSKYKNKESLPPPFVPANNNGSNVPIRKQDTLPSFLQKCHNTPTAVPTTDPCAPTVSDCSVEVSDGFSAEEASTTHLSWASEKRELHRKLSFLLSPLFANLYLFLDDRRQES